MTDLEKILDALNDIKLKDLKDLKNIKSKEQYSIIEIKLDQLYKNQEQLLEAIKLIASLLIIK